MESRREIFFSFFFFFFFFFFFCFHSITHTYTHNMATLDAFLVRGKKKTQPSIQDTHIKHAFVNPFTAQTKKPLVATSNKAPVKKPAKNQTKRNTITHYFTPTEDTDVDVEMEDAAEICVIRNKMPVMNLWDMIQYELDQDPFYNDMVDEPSRAAKATTALAISNNCMSRRRPRQSDAIAEQSSKRQKKTDHELSNIMARFLNMGSAIKQHPPMSSLDFMNDFSEDTEDLSRQVRHKQTLQESHLFVYNITQEFLY
ncbi:hypothetical protein PS15p_205645 [Mucor circinelloides]